MTTDSNPIAPPARAVLITGGAVRLGRQTALHLASKGWHVAVHYHRSADEAEATATAIRAQGVCAAAIPGDLTAEHVETLPSRAASALGMPLTALVNNAAVFHKDNIHNLDRASWLQHMDTNLYAPLMLAQGFAAQLPDTATGSIVNLIDGCEGSCLSAPFLSYSLSKYGLAQATRLLAQGLAPRIRVNGVSPGLTLPKDGEDEMFVRLVSKLPLQRPTAPQDIAHAIDFLLETPSITGQILALDGGAAVRKGG